MNYYIVAIDPGKQGFITVLRVNPTELIESKPIPLKKILTTKKKKVISRTRIDTDKLGSLLDDILSKYVIKEVVIEEQILISKQGLISGGVIMEHYGWLKGFCEAKKVEYCIVSAKEWQTIYPENIRLIKEPKERSKQYCSELLPNVDLRRTNRSKNISDGKTDSILIGMYRIKQIYEVN